MTRDELWVSTIKKALVHYRRASRKDKDTTEQMLQGLHAGMSILLVRLDRGSMRTNDLAQLIACALDCLAACTCDAVERGEEPKRPSEVEGSS
jgi:hypothetical protein